MRDDLVPGQRLLLEDHVSSCSDCQQELEQLAGGAEWRISVQHHLSSTLSPAATPTRTPGNSPSVADLLSSLEPECETHLDFLEPVDDPNKLGRIGPYEIDSVIGRGGMGVVLKAFDPGLNRHVAIKVMAAQLATNGAARKRFSREAQAAAAVVHEHVVAIHAVDTSGKLPYIVMPYIPGRSLQDRLDESGPLEIREILRISIQTGLGLAAAHAQGLVHRDIKPANILLENGIERVRITDFGLARAVDDASQTQSGFIAGTPQYMAPEQARGESIDHRSDLFSLGSVIYAMCTGRPPFRAESTLAVLRRICEEAARPIREINPDIPEWLPAVVEKLHSRAPDDRFSSALEVAELLQNYLAHLQHPMVIPMPRFHIVLPDGSPWSHNFWKRVAIWATPLFVLCAFSAVSAYFAFTNTDDRPRSGVKYSPVLANVQESAMSMSGQPSGIPIGSISATNRPTPKDPWEKNLIRLQEDVTSLEKQLAMKSSQNHQLPLDKEVLEMKVQLKNLESEFKR